MKVLLLCLGCRQFPLAGCGPPLDMDALPSSELCKQYHVFWLYAVRRIIKNRGIMITNIQVPCAHQGNQPGCIMKEYVTQVQWDNSYVIAGSQLAAIVHPGSTMYVPEAILVGFMLYVCADIKILYCIFVCCNNNMKVRYKNTSKIHLSNIVLCQMSM